jgi:hypothetical protein
MYDHFPVLSLTPYVGGKFHMFCTKISHILALFSHLPMNISWKSPFLYVKSQMFNPKKSICKFLVGEIPSFPSKTPWHFQHPTPPPPGTHP